MRRLCYFVFILISFLQSENKNVLEFDEKFSLKEPGSTIPYGQKILLTGHAANGTISIEVSILSTIKEETIKATIRDSVWSVVVGPFMPNQTIFFRFSKISRLDRAMVENIVKSTLDSITIKTFTEFVSGTDDELKKSLKHSIGIAIPDSVKKYSSKSGTTLESALKKELTEKESIDEIVGVMNGLKEIQEKEVESNEIIKKIDTLFLKQKEKTAKYAGANVLVDIQKNPNQLKIDSSARHLILKAVASIVDSVKENQIYKTLVNGLTQLDKNQKNIALNQLNISRQIDDVVQSVADSLMSTETFENPENFPTVSNDVSDIENYAGMDISAIAIPNVALAPFFTINPYFGNVPTNKDPQLWYEYFSLSAGIALSSASITSQGTAYFVGIGIRPNKIFRVNLGSTFYKPSNGSLLHWRFAGGVSINFRYFNKILESFSSAGTALPGQTQP